MTELFFYLFAALMIFSALNVIIVKNPVHSVLWLILSFFGASGLFILLGAEFLAMALIVVYVGAVAVLFLFVVMMLNINFVALKEGFIKYLPFCLLISLVVFADFYLVHYYSIAKFDADTLNPGHKLIVSTTNTHEIGKVLYTKYFFPFQIAGLILFVAMIGSICLTLRHRVGVKKQNPYKQLNRTKEMSMEVVKVKTGQGVE